MNKPIVIATLIATMGLVACQSPKRDFRQIQENIDTAAAGDFGVCMQTLYNAAAELETARTLVAKGRRSGLSDTDFNRASIASQNAIRDRRSAEEVCNIRVMALENRSVGLERNMGVLNNNVTTLNQNITEVDNRLQRTKEVLRGVTFATGSAQISQKGRETLRVVANRLLRQPTRVVIEGHTSSVGQLDFNMRLSQARADAVRQFLVAQGVPPNTVTAVGLGPSQPVASNDTAEGQRANQRIEIRYEQEIR